MWGQSVRVVTRRPEVARERTLVLEFETGLRTRPIVRNATRDELILDGGTRVRVWLNESPYEARGLLRAGDHDDSWTLPDLCAWLAPALDVNLFVEQEVQGRELVIAARDWVTVEGKELLKRIQGPKFRSNENPPEKDVVGWAQNLQLIEDEDSTVVGRAFVCQREYQLPRPAGRRTKYREAHYEFGVVTVGGFRSTRLSGLGGILVGDPLRAARDQAVPRMGQSALTKWATEQAKLLPRLVEEEDSQLDVASVIRALGGDTGPLLIARTASGWVTLADIADRAQPDEVVLVQDAAVSLMEKDLDKEIELKPHVFVTSVGRPGILQTGFFDRTPDWPPEERWSAYERAWFHGATLEGVVIEALAKAWDKPLSKVIEASDFSTDDTDVEVEVGTANGETIMIDNVDIIRNLK